MLAKIFVILREEEIERGEERGRATWTSKIGKCICVNCKMISDVA